MALLNGKAQGISALLLTDSEDLIRQVSHICGYAEGVLRLVVSDEEDRFLSLLSQCQRSVLLIDYKVTKSSHFPELMSLASGAKVPTILFVPRDKWQYSLKLPYSFYRVLPLPIKMIQLEQSFYSIIQKKVQLDKTGANDVVNVPESSVVMQGEGDQSSGVVSRFRIVGLFLSAAMVVGVVVAKIGYLNTPAHNHPVKTTTLAEPDLNEADDFKVESTNTEAKKLQLVRSVDNSSLSAGSLSTVDVADQESANFSPTPTPTPTPKVVTVPMIDALAKNELKIDTKISKSAKSIQSLPVHTNAKENKLDPIAVEGNIKLAITQDVKGSQKGLGNSIKVSPNVGSKKINKKMENVASDALSQKPSVANVLLKGPEVEGFRGRDNEKKYKLTDKNSPNNATNGVSDLNKPTFVNTIDEEEKSDANVLNKGKERAAINAESTGQRYDQLPNQQVILDQIEEKLSAGQISSDVAEVIFNNLAYIGEVDRGVYATQVEGMIERLLAKHSIWLMNNLNDENLNGSSQFHARLKRSEYSTQKSVLAFGSFVHIMGQRLK